MQRMSKVRGGLTAQHLLVNYQRAHVAIIKAQFTCKRQRDGMLVRPWPPAPVHSQ